MTAISYWTRTSGFVAEPHFVWSLIQEKEHTKMSCKQCICGLLAIFTLVCLVTSDESDDGGQHNPLHDSKLTHDKE